MDLKPAPRGDAEVLTGLALHGSGNYSRDLGLDAEPHDNLLHVELGDLHTIDHGHQH
jgi:hypothetical protein